MSPLEPPTPQSPHLSLSAVAITSTATLTLSVVGSAFPSCFVWVRVFCHILALSKLSCGLFHKVFDKVNLIGHENNHSRGEVNSFLNLIDMESSYCKKLIAHSYCVKNWLRFTLLSIKKKL